jgi:hypothetical protein
VCGCGALVNHADPLIAAHGLDEECSTVRLPAYTTSWQHAGPLLEEMWPDLWKRYQRRDDPLVHSLVHMLIQAGFTPEAVCRAWLAWQEARG